MTNITPEQIAKLPKWAQEHVQTITRQRDTAVKTLNEAVDRQTPTPVYYEEFVSLGENKGPTTKRFYGDTKNVKFNHAGVCLEVFLARPDDGQRPFGIEVRYSGSERMFHPVALIPGGTNTIHLVAKANMR